MTQSYVIRCVTVEVTSSFLSFPLPFFSLSLSRLFARKRKRALTRFSLSLSLSPFLSLIHASSRGNSFCSGSSSPGSSKLREKNSIIYRREKLIVRTKNRDGGDDDGSNDDGSNDAAFANSSAFLTNFYRRELRKFSPGAENALSVPQR